VCQNGRRNSRHPDLAYRAVALAPAFRDCEVIPWHGDVQPPCTAKAADHRRLQPTELNSLPTLVDVPRALAVNSKTEGRGFESFRPCQLVLAAVVFRIASFWPAWRRLFGILVDIRVQPRDTAQRGRRRSLLADLYGPLNRPNDSCTRRPRFYTRPSVSWQAALKSSASHPLMSRGISLTTHRSGTT